MNSDVKLANPVVFFCAFILSAFGFEFIMFIMTVHIYKLTGSPLDVGIFTTLAFLPRIFSQYYGALIDKYSRKFFLAFSNIAISFLLVVLSFTQHIYILYTIWFFISLFSIVVLTARSAALTDVIKKDNYVQGNAIALTMLNTAKLVAPLVGGVIAGATDIAAILYFTSAVYIITFFLVLLLKLPLTSVADEKRVAAINEHIVEGLRYMFGEPTLRFLLSAVFSWRLLFGLQASLFVVYVQAHLNLGTEQYGVFMTCIGVGSLLGGFLGSKIALKFDEYKLALSGLSVHFLSFSLLGIIHSYYLAMAIQIISYASLYMSVVGIHAIRDTATKPEMRGRVMGSLTAIVAPPAIISMLGGGYLAEQYGVHNVFIGVGIIGFLILHAAYYYASTRHRLATINR